MDKAMVVPNAKLVPILQGKNEGLAVLAATQTKAASAQPAEGHLQAAPCPTHHRINLLTAGSSAELGLRHLVKRACQCEATYNKADTPDIYTASGLPINLKMLNRPPRSDPFTLDKTDYQGHEIIFVGSNQHQGWVH